MSDNPTRQTLLMKIKDRYDEQAWEEFCQYYGGYIRSILYRAEVHVDEIDDLLQETLVKAWRSLPQFEYRPGKCKFRSWLGIMVRNTAATYFKSKNYRTRQKFPAQDIESLPESQFLECNEPEIEVVIEKEWRSYIATLAWERIEDSFSDKVLQVFLDIADGLPTEAICTKHDIEASSVYVYKSRVAKALKRELYFLDQQLG